MKSFYKIIIIGLLIFISSCSSMDKNDRKSRRHDFLNKFSSKELTASISSKFWDYSLILRKNKSFVYKQKVFGLVTGEYYSGTYLIKGDTLKLVFHKNYKPMDIKNDYLIFDKIDSTKILRFDNNYYFVITKTKKL
jgi:hypothetical protein